MSKEVNKHVIITCNNCSRSIILLEKEYKKYNKELVCPYCNSDKLMKVETPENNKDTSIKKRQTKAPSEPIPEYKYQQFKYKIKEMSSLYAERNITLFLLGVATGYRCDDIIDLTVGEIREALDDGFFFIQEKKQYKSWKTKNTGKKPPKKRKAIIKNNLRKVLKDYVKGRLDSEYAFKSNKGDYLSVKSYSDFLSTVGKSLELKHIGAHSMRKTYATRLWNNSHDLEYVRKALGHKDIKTTQLYLGLDNETLTNAAETVDEKL